MARAKFELLVEVEGEGGEFVRTAGAALDLRQELHKFHGGSRVIVSRVERVTWDLVKAWAVEERREKEAADGAGA